MQIVLELPEEEYRWILQSDKTIFADVASKECMLHAIKSGTPLPKGHGRLIDADEYKEHLYACETNGRPLHIMELDERLATVDEAPTIIEADEENRYVRTC